MRLRAIIICILLLLATVATAQTDISVGEYTGTITDEVSSQRYRFEATAGDVLTISMIASAENELDPFLLLLDSGGQLIASNDDIEPTNRNARIEHTIPTTGTYIVEATRYQQEIGTTTGAYTLTLDTSAAPSPVDTSDPLSQLPQFGVEFRFLALSETLTDNRLDSATTSQYFAIGGQQGQLLRISVRSLDDLQTSVSLVNRQFTVLSRVGLDDDRQTVVFAAIPETGWYLVEVAQVSGAGAYTIRADIVSDTVLTQDSPIEATLTPGRQELQYIFNATINERVFINLTVLSDVGDIIPRIEVLDLQQNVLGQAQSTGTQTRVSLTIPRSGPYIVIVSNIGVIRQADFRLQLRGIPPDVSKLQATQVTYNDDYTGTITQDDFIEYYRFTGKTGELVTIEMVSAVGYNQLDPFVILTDSRLNELAFNDNIGASRAARIFQFALPRDDTYYILATRAELERGVTTGNYILSITVGEIVLEDGALTATLSWEGDNDLNLFINTPDGRTISWANPTPAETNGRLQIDSNTTCETPSAQPVEHIVFDNSESLPVGDYTAWVWYQEVCTTPDSISFSITIDVAGETVLELLSEGAIPPILEPQQRFEASFRLTETGNAVPLDRGSISTPSEQQSASQGGDTLLIYGQSVTDTITNTRYANFYHFNGLEGETVRIHAEAVAGSLDTVLVLRDNFDNNLVINDDSTARDANSVIEFELPYTGRYIIGVSRYGVRDGTSTGDYRLILERVE